MPKQHAFVRAGVTSTLMMTGLLGFAWTAPLLPAPEVRGAAGDLLDVMQRRELNQEAIADHTAGYYEGLLNEGNRVSSMNAIVTGRLGINRRPPASGDANIRALRLPDRYVRRGDFLYYEPRPNLDLADYDDSGLRLVTNSTGLSDREYTVARPPDVRRLAVLGDSVTRGQGAPFGRSYEAQLEEMLNRKPRLGIAQYEILNFAVSGYRLTQVLEAAAIKAAPYRPDLYIVGISELAISRRWGDHLEQLVSEGVDLKYGFLRDLVARAGVRAGDPPETTKAKLAPHRLDTIERILSELRRVAAERDGQVLVLLVPTVREAAQLRKDFEGIPDVLRRLQMPCVDLLDTFREVPDLDAYRVSPDNYHPNEAGHRKLFERLYAAVASDPALADLVLGPRGTRE